MGVGVEPGPEAGRPAVRRRGAPRAGVARGDPAAPQDSPAPGGGRLPCDHGPTRPVRGEEARVSIQSQAVETGAVGAAATGGPAPPPRRAPRLLACLTCLALGAAAAQGVAGAAAAGAGATGGEAALGADACAAELAATTQAYARPARQAARFGAPLAAGERVALVGRSHDGWWAFAPGVAQAANVGPFRLRWYPPETALRIPDTPACRDLPVVAGPPAGVCFQMAQAAQTLRVAPSEDASVLSTLAPGDWVAIVGGNGAWLELDTAVGSITNKGHAYLPRAQANVNGPCEAALAPPP